MACYDIVITRAAKSELRRVHSQYRQRIADAIDALAEDPRPDGFRMVQGEENTYRIRIGTYRVLYEVHEQEVIVKIVRVSPRGQAYQRLH